jgi:predicted branched-subunit amino acid permease
MTEPRWQFTSKQEAIRRGLRDGLGVPAAVLFAGMMGFGALGHSIGLSLSLTGGTTIFMFALPGQIVFVEMMAVGASAWLAGLSAMVTAARFLPMTLTVLPQIPAAHQSRFRYLTVHMLALTTWSVAMRDFPKMAPQYRQAYLIGLSAACYGCAIPGTFLGYLLAGQVPLPLTLALLFVNPLFFYLTFFEVRPLANRLALVLGALVGLGVHLVSPDYSILAAGLIGGSLAFGLSHGKAGHT